MAFNINNFKTEIAQNGVLQNNKYDVYINVPSNLSNFTISDPTGGEIQLSSTAITQKLLMRAEDLIIPSASLAVLEVNRYGYGNSRKVPYNILNNIINLTFISDDYGEIWQFFYMWLKSIYNFAGIDNANGFISNSMGNYVLDYKDNYAVDMSINVYDNIGRKVLVHDFTEAYPFGLNDVRMNWNMDNQLLKITVAMAFTEHMIQGATLGGINNN